MKLSGKIECEMENRLTSLELSKKLWDAGCKLKTVELGDKDFYTIVIDGEIINIPAYDLLWDVCVKYVKKFFHQGVCLIHSEKIFRFIQYGEKQEAEYYIWRHCKFNTEKVGEKRNEKG